MNRGRNTAILAVLAATWISSILAASSLSNTLPRGLSGASAAGASRFRSTKNK